MNVQVNLPDQHAGLLAYRLVTIVMLPESSVALIRNGDDELVGTAMSVDPELVCASIR